MEPKKKKKKSACFVYIDTCVPWMAIETKKMCVLCEKEKKEKKEKNNTKTVCVLCTLILVHLEWPLKFFF